MPFLLFLLFASITYKPVSRAVGLTPSARGGNPVVFANDDYILFDDDSIIAWDDDSYIIWDQ